MIDFTTFKRDQWNQLLIAASKLSSDELQRHARVSTSNRHKCKECFTCACEVVRYFRATNTRLTIHEI